MLDLNKLYVMDCIKGLKQLPDNSAQIVIADPPYNIGKDFGNEQYLMIYCDYKNPELSECHDGGEKYYRYCVILDLAMDRNQINPKVLGNFETIDEVKQLVLNKSVEDFINMEDVYAKS